ncbi:MAG: hypothetical protein Q9222_005021 [Ikaeria aurantiellina]
MRPTRLSLISPLLRPLQPQITASIRRNLGTCLPKVKPSPFYRLFARNVNRKPIRHSLSRRWNSNKPSFNPTPNLGSPEPSLSLSQRLRKLSREYGWSALGVYLMLTALDFPFCFLAVRLVGTDRIGHLESVIVQGFWKIFSYPFGSHAAPQPVGNESTVVRVEEYGAVDSNKDEVGVPGYDHGLEEAEERNKSDDASALSNGYQGCFNLLLTED